MNAQRTLSVRCYGGLLQIIWENAQATIDLRFSDIEVGKVPTVVWYSEDGNESVAGSETTKGHFRARRDADGWRRAQRCVSLLRVMGQSDC